MNNHDWDDNEAPLAYLITFRTYGTWLHGDDRHSIDRHGKNIYGGPKVLPSKNLARIMAENRKNEEFILNGPARKVVEDAMRNVCRFRGYELYAINVRTNHAHSVVNAYMHPDKVVNAFKANCTRELRVAGLVSDRQKVWSRGASTRYLWKTNHVQRAIDYVFFGQGDDLPDF